MRMWILQSWVYYYSIQAVRVTNPMFEQEIEDGFLRTRRWTSRSLRVEGYRNGVSPKTRVQACLELLEREWMEIEDRHLYYLVLCKSREHLSGWDFIVDSHPPREGPATQLFGRLEGPNVRARLMWVLDTLQIDRQNMPELQ
jgi:hypothetical protein